MLTTRYQVTFKKDYKRIKKRGYDIRLLEKVIALLAKGQPLPAQYRDHRLSGDYDGCRECHISPEQELTAIYFDLGSTTCRLSRLCFLQIHDNSEKELIF